LALSLGGKAAEFNRCPVLLQQS